ncbi:Uncharacterized conserved protein, DUF952 family [Plantibacter sp. VKM Ac-1784]|uniref:Uncharacterized conserved protein, DUF952 family n=1 Tax=Plantibacter elymi (nom. nud.) TaxID=199708 RepID=A0ABY1RIG2_9MICO|nr:DUF952 domain-containing protein [Plantibacter sp. VKM Ac-1784]SMQ75196.1 Uncharacterized conserved protein, DUF952 family [Plantibacter sp. VKM Ac-1784]
MTKILHVAIVDDWEASRPFGEYEVSTRAVPFVDAGFVHATSADRLPEVLERVYGSLQLPLVLIVLDVEELQAAGIEVVLKPEPRVLAPLPTAGSAVVAELPLERDGSGAWQSPQTLP